ncbi:hypothetical protein [Rathayibacter sp. AY1E1]|uniref:hypothetical protein n=1 Tax=Rathayibacter sp. AY1E1 TaxID=2080549 RepID=UPI000CE77385|nr:hypothetical protein [Rathayibacter sp. AY1E1]PPH51224.1 hypothetical protein C5C67_11960 [Rathayibacter sp. AY1E1]
MISASDLQSREYLRAPDETKPTALGLWLHTDVFGCRELIPELIAGDLYPGRDATEMVTEHLLMLDDSGFLRIYFAEGREWIELTRPLRADRRGATHECPPNPARGRPWESVAVGRGAGERASEWAREQARAEDEARAAAWAAVRGDREAESASVPPTRPLLLDAPPIGCVEHPDGRGQACGPCRTARQQRDLWLSRRVYESQLEQYHLAAAARFESEG